MTPSTKNPKLAVILKYFYLKAQALEKAPVEVVSKEAQQQIYQAGLEIIGEDEPEVWVEQSEGVKSVEAGLVFRNHYRKQLRSKWAEFCGKDKS